MFRLYSKGCEYAIRALVYAARKRDTLNFTAKEVCRKARIPESFTRKVFQSLVKENYLQAVPGNSGGYRLSKDPSKVSILEIVKAVDGKDVFDHCIMGSSTKCSNKRPCPMHSTWDNTKKHLLLQLESKQLQDLVEIFQSSAKQGKRIKVKRSQKHDR